MAKRASPPDFRYVGLVPDAAPKSAAVVRAIVAAGALAVGAGVALHNPAVMGLAAGTLLGGVAISIGRRREAGVVIPFGARAVAMGVTPWGIIVSPDVEPRVLRWSAVRRVEVKTAHEMRGGTPTALASVVVVRVGKREVLAGRIAGPAGLEGLTANLSAYADEAARPLAGDLEGIEAIGEPLDPVVGDLVRRAREMCASADGARVLSLPPRGYRDVSSKAAGPETLALLRRVLRHGGEGAADPRPLAAMIAGELRARALMPDLARLGTSPHPVVAGAARAAALLLGAPPNRAGALDEVQSFLHPDDLDELERWSTGARMSAFDVDLEDDRQSGWTSLSAAPGDEKASA